MIKQNVTNLLVSDLQKEAVFKSMKVIIINTLYSPYKIGGAEVSIQLLAETLVAQGHQIRVLCLHSEKEKKISINNGVEVVYLPLSNIYWPFCCDKQIPVWKRICWHLLDNYNPFMAYKIGRELDEFNPDVVHTNNLAGFSVAVWKQVKKRNIRLVHTTRDYYLFHPNTTLFRNGSNMPLSSFSVKVWSWVKRLASRQVDVAIGISHFISDLHKKDNFFPASAHVCIYNSVKKPIVNTIDSDLLRVGFIGRLTEDKGFDTFCEIASLYKDEPDKYKFIAAGRFGNDNNGKCLSEKAGQLKIKLLGFVGLEKFLSEVDVVVLPIKWREPFGRTVVECALTNKPVFTSRNGGVAELFSFFENIYDNTSIDLLPNFMKEKTYRLIENKNDSTIDFFSESKNASLYLHVYLHV